MSYGTSKKRRKTLDYFILLFSAFQPNNTRLSVKLQFIGSKNDQEILDVSIDRGQGKAV